MAGTPAEKRRYFGTFTSLLLLLVPVAVGDLEPVLGRCCAYGANWAREGQQCGSFPAPVAGVPSEHQFVCLTSVGICCLRYFRDEQCQKGRQAAQVGQDCIPGTGQGAEYFKDCCQGCKLGLVSGSMGMGCNMRFKFGLPWDKMFVQCCNQVATSSTSSSGFTPGDYSSTLGVEGDNLYPGVTSPGSIPEGEDLCARFPGTLCAHVCVPTPGSYRCQCRAGFTLSSDAKTCIQDTASDRCQLNNPCAHQCRDTGIAIECSCNPGYTLAADQRSCQDVDECNSGLAKCITGEQVCYNQPGSYACINADGSLSSPGAPTLGVVPGAGVGLGYEISNEVDPNPIPSTSQGRCPTGYNYNLETRTCDDVQECEVIPGLCGPGGRCQNTIGSYTCSHATTTSITTVPECPQGYAFDTNHQSCLDVDECLAGTNNCDRVTQFCLNTPGGFTCQENSGPNDCIAGYKFSVTQQTCVDVDECAENLAACDPETETCRNTAGAYECDIMCDPGFQFSPILATCVDSDECLEVPCEVGFECHNTPGSYMCHQLPRAFCPAGYKPANTTGSGCEDVDECEEGLHSCQAEVEVCVNEIGKYRCEPVSQRQGHQHQGHQQQGHQQLGQQQGHQQLGQQQGHQQLGHQQLGHQQLGHQQLGQQQGQQQQGQQQQGHQQQGHQQQGHQQQGHHQQQESESQYLNLPPPLHQQQGQECPNGFGYDPASTQCLDIDECSNGLHNCALTELCINTLGSFLCQPRHLCPAGFAPDPTTGQCHDIDECIGGAAGCLPGQICHNTQGAFECRVECQDGFRYDPTDEAVCVDVDECLSEPCASNQECTNIEGSYICTTIAAIQTTTTTTTTTATPNYCPAGYEANPSTYQCEDVDECSGDVCEAGQRCINTRGSYSCIWPPCDQGYTRHPQTNQCQDIDECELGLHQCGVGVERCLNTPGGHVCQPRPCSPGFTRHPDNPAHCTDVDECESNPCGRGEECENSEGSFTCHARTPCQLGFRRDTQTQECQDIDECAESSPCGVDERCVNTRGSYRCRTLDCNPGYSADAWGRCQDIDECESGEHNCQSPQEECVNSPGSYQCKPLPPCPQGFKRHPETLRCVDRDECAEGSHDCRGGERCLNQYGRYVCRAASSRDCHPGYRYTSLNRRCADIDECAEKLDSCDWARQTCINSVGSFRCIDRRPTCDFGYQYNEEQSTCVDVDECEENPGVCGSGSECRNTLGSYQCGQMEPDSHICQPGYTFNTTARACTDIDECSEGRHDCSAVETCINRLGSYACEAAGVGGGVHSFNTTAYSSEEDQATSDYEVVLAQPRPTGTRGRCEEGYRYNRRRRACVDINECTEGRDICNRKIEECVNTKGDYWCAPLLNPPTYVTTPSITTPAPVTKPGNFSIPPTPPLPPRPELPIPPLPPLPELPTLPLPPRPDLPTPACPSGTAYDPEAKKCSDIDECASSPCEEGEECRNTQGSYQCTCQVGYVMDEEQCTDVNECQLGLHECTNFQRCDNTVGSYACVRMSGCGTGYTLNHNTGECDDDDECKLKTHNCDPLGPKYHCVNIKGSFRCKRKTCPLNQVLDSAGACVNLTCGVGFMPLNSICIDINECVVGGLSSPCNRNERCINTLGSYQCRPLLLCGAGYKMNEVGSQCIDIDECEDGTHQCEGNQLCSNRQGGYICQCPPGYRLNAQRNCQDINECESYYGSVCSNNAECENTPGSYRCLCKEGFKDSPTGKLCIDIDECTEVPGICHHNCLNVWGGHQCTCRAGYLLTADNRTCEDINECEEVRGRGRLCIGFCVNNPGSFSCSCPDGYTLAADGRTCKDVNECESGTVCRNSEDHCVNTRGGFKCNTINCPENYIRDTRHRNRCKKETTFCLASDEACQLQPLSYSYNFLPLVSNMTLPPLGQVDLFTMRGPLWASTTVQFSLELDEATAPPGIPVATQEFFYLKRTSFNQAVISLVRPVLGPQEIDLALNMKLYQQGQYTGSAVAKLLIYVSKYEF